MIKKIYEKPIANILLNDERQYFPCKIGNMEGIYILTMLIQCSIGTSSYCCKAKTKIKKEGKTEGRKEEREKGGKGRKGTQVGKKTKLSLIPNSMVAYIENMNRSSKNMHK